MKERFNQLNELEFETKQLFLKMLEIMDKAINELNKEYERNEK